MAEINTVEIARSFGIKTQVAKTFEEALKSARPDDETDNDKAGDRLDKRMASIVAQTLVVFGH